MLTAESVNKCNISNMTHKFYNEEIKKKTTQNVKLVI